jgi:hypothetical protein
MTKNYLQKLFHYIDSVYKMGEKIKSLKDERKNKRIKTSAVALVVLVGFMLKIRSFNQLDNWLENKDFNKLVPRKLRLPRIDAVRDSLKSFDMDSLNKMHNDIVGESITKKLFRTGTIDGLKVVAFDGVELFESTKKCCEDCLTRVINEVPHYFHRSVVAAYVGKDPHFVIGQEMLKPKKDSSNKDEGEQTGAKRLMSKMYERFHHFADVIVYDAGGCNAPWINTVKSYSMDAVVRVKDERLNIVKDALGLFQNRICDDVWSFNKNKNTEVIIYAWHDNIEMKGVEGTVRFAKFLEETKNLKTGKTVVCEVWIITTSKHLSLKTLWKIIHARWGIENNIFRQLKTEWHMDHCFIHDETGLEATLMFMIIAFNLMQLFFFRRLRNFRKNRLLQVEVIERLIKQLVSYNPKGKYFFSTG